MASRPKKLVLTRSILLHTIRERTENFLCHLDTDDPDWAILASDVGQIKTLVKLYRHIPPKRRAS